MVEGQSQTCLAKSDVSSSFDHGESDGDSVSTDEHDETPAKTFNYCDVAPEKNSDAVAAFENISVCNSADIQFGNKTFYNGPVTIKQFVYAAEEKAPTHNASSRGGNINGAFVFQNYDNVELSDTVPSNSDVGILNTSDKTAGLGQKLNCCSSTLQETSKSAKAFQTGCFTCMGPLQQYFAVAGAVLIVVLLLAVVIVMVLKYEDRSASNVAPSATVVGPRTDDNFTLSGKLRVMPRKQWLAQPVSEHIDELKTPVPYVIISHTATEQCVLISQCVLQVRTIQTFHIESRGWSDIGYNFLVGGDGFVYMGRGWDLVGAHTFGYNNISIGISFIGTFNTVLPPSRQITAAQQLIEVGVELGKISKDYKLLAHRQASPTESPGATFFKEIQKWPHWAHDP